MRTSRLLIAAALFVVLDTAAAFLVQARDGLADLTTFTPAEDSSRLVTTTVAKESFGTWQVDMTAPAVCDVNEACDLTFRLIPMDGWHANRQFPTKLWMDPSAFLTTTAQNVDVKSDGTAEVHMTIIPRAAGTHALAARLRVSACNEEMCRIARHDIALVVRARS